MPRFTSIALVAFFCAVSVVSSAPSCSCGPLCKPLTSDLPKKEILAFHPSSDPNYTKYGNVTTIAVFGDLDFDLICFAHQRNIRVVKGVDFPNAQIGNVSAETAWIDTTFSLISSFGADGVNIDIEGNGANRDALTDLTKRLTDRFKAANPVASISFDTSIYAPNNSKGYDFVGLSNVVDFLVPMGYDMCWGTHVATANSPLPRLISGLEEYNTDGVPPSKLVLGLPWYGYDFPCSSTTAGAECEINVPFGGGAWQVAYSSVMESLGSAITSVTLNTTLMTKHFDVLVAGKRHQIWYDDAETLTAKYSMATSKQLRGLAMWHADCLDYSNSTQVTSMWNAINPFV